MDLFDFVFILRLAFNIKSLQNNKNSLTQLDSTMEGFIKWMAEMDSSLSRLVDETGRGDVRQNEELCSEYLVQFKVSMQKY
jgi:hypothetical protein